MPPTYSPTCRGSNSKKGSQQTKKCPGPKVLSQAKVSSLLTPPPSRSGLSASGTEGSLPGRLGTYRWSSALDVQGAGGLERSQAGAPGVGETVEEP